MKTLMKRVQCKCTLMEHYWEFCMCILTYGSRGQGEWDIIWAGELNEGLSVQMLDSGPPPAPHGAPSWELSAHKPFHCGHGECLQQGPAPWNVKQDQIYTLNHANEWHFRNHTACHISLRWTRQNKSNRHKIKGQHNYTLSFTTTSVCVCGKRCDFSSLCFVLFWNNIFMYNGIYKQNYKSAKKRLLKSEDRSATSTQWREKPTAVACAAFWRRNRIIIIAVLCEYLWVWTC